MHSPMRRVALAATTLLLSTALSGPAARHASATSAATATSLPFPRLANYDGYSDPSQAPIFSRYGLVIAWDSLTTTHPAAIQALRSSSPAPTILAYERAAQVDVADQNHYGTNAIYPGWWLLKAGSTLTSNVNSTQTTLYVANTAPFQKGQDILVDGESMHVTSVTSSNKSITVQRGYYSTAASHNSGAHIAPHTFLDMGGPNGDHPWALNMSSVCPRNPQGQRWVDFLASWIKNSVMSSGLWDGVFYDNSNDKLYDNTIDVNDDNTGDGGVINGVNVWQQGIGQLFSQTRASLSSAVIMGTGPQFSNYDWANGQEFNTTDITDPVKYGALVANYHYHMTASVAPTISMINPSTPGDLWNLQLMRFGLTTALLDNGVYTYDQGATQNGYPWWFDEYDNGAGTALAGYVSSSATQLPVVRGSIFHVGDTVMVENEMMRVTGISGNTLTVSRGYNSTTPDTHHTGAVVATQQQVQQGLGYLGQPTGSAYAINASSTNLVANGGFDLGTVTPWKLGITAPAAGTMALDTSTHASGVASLKGAVTAIDGGDLDVEPQQTQLALIGGQSYAISFSAKSSVEHYVHVLLCSLHSNPSCVADARLGVRSTWTPYTLNFAAPSTVTDAQLKFGLSDVTGTTWVDSVSMVQMPQPVQRRDFTNGTVLVNPGPSTQTVTLPSGYCHLRGDQNSSLNNGAPVSSVSIPAQDGVILVRCSGGAPTPTPQPAGTASGTYSGSLSASGASDSYSFQPNTSGSATIASCAVSTGDRVGLYVYNSAGTKISSATSSSYCNWTSASVSAGQSYTVKTVATSGSGVYRSAWNVNGAPVTWDVSGSINSSGASTTFSFPVLGSGALAFSTCGPTGTNFAVHLLSSSGATLAGSSSSSTCKSFSYTPSTRDLYRLQETSMSGSGHYAGTITGGTTSAAMVPNTSADSSNSGVAAPDPSTPEPTATISPTSTLAPTSTATPAITATPSVTPEQPTATPSGATATPIATATAGSSSTTPTAGS